MWMRWAKISQVKHKHNGIPLLLWFFPAGVEILTSDMLILSAFF